MSRDSDKDRVLAFIFDSLPPAAVLELREKDYWQRAMKVVEDALREPPEKCPWCKGDWTQGKRRTNSFGDEVEG